MKKSIIILSLIWLSGFYFLWNLHLKIDIGYGWALLILICYFLLPFLIVIIIDKIDYSVIESSLIIHILVSILCSSKI